jgi:hypothetical protein
MYSVVNVCDGKVDAGQREPRQAHHSNRSSRTRSDPALITLAMPFKNWIAACAGMSGDGLSEPS